MSKRPMPPLNGRNPAKRRNPGKSVPQMQTQIRAQDVPVYLKKPTPIDPEAFIYAEVLMVWKDEGRVVLRDVGPTEAGANRARFSAFFAGNWLVFSITSNHRKGFVCIWQMRQSAGWGSSKQDTLNLPFSLSYNERCRLRRVEKGMAGPPVTFTARTWPLFPSSVLVTDS